jgi:hypothetical protein
MLSDADTIAGSKGILGYLHAGRYVVDQFASEPAAIGPHKRALGRHVQAKGKVDL